MDTSSYGFLFPQEYANIERLIGPVAIDNINYLDRGFYKIKLNNVKTSDHVIRSEYEIIFNLSAVPGVKFLKVLIHCFEEIFYLIKHNPHVGQGSLFTRIAISSDTLKGKTLNLRAVELNRNGAKMLINEIEKVLQSNDNFFLDKQLYVRFISVKDDELANRLNQLRQQHV